MTIAPAKRLNSGSRLVRQMAADARLLCAELEQRLERGDDAELMAARESLAEVQGREQTAGEAADILAQGVVCAGAILQAGLPEASRASEWLRERLLPWEQWVLEQAAQMPAVQGECEIPRGHLYDAFLHYYCRKSRQRHGVFFTPQAIADYIVRQIDRLLREEFGLAEGIAERHGGRALQHNSPVFIDPAAGSGVFLLTVLEQVWRGVRENCGAEGCSAEETSRRWNAAANDLLPRLIGVELLPAAALVAKINIVFKLAETGYAFEGAAPLNVFAGDALAEATQARIADCRLQIADSGATFPVIFGNPPFRSLSMNSSAWISRLVRGDAEVRGYVRAGAQKLNERKTWLHDDYVKFIRLAQWHVEEAGSGIVGFVTNHGYLDNATFRLMRQELLRVFPRVSIVDLHGSRKNYEVAPDGLRDENVFGLDQGIAIGLFCRGGRDGSGGEEVSAGSVRYAELWGSREGKLRALMAERDSPLLAQRASVLRPDAPDWRLVPTSGEATPKEYAAGWSLAEAMPVNSSAPVTARDHFVVGFTREEVCARVQVFCDLSIPDDEIRNRFFTRTRSSRYPQGDTRGWKLSLARQAVVADADWPRKIVRCLYRPFDWRYVFWHPAMIDWPRAEVTRHLVQETGVRSQESEAVGPVCLIARRQQLPSQACTFFWASDGLALDGVIRSDNRGSESLFPVYLRGDDPGAGCWRANFAVGFVEQFCTALELDWLPLGKGDLVRTFGPEDLVGYIYALFHAPLYRSRYAADLRSDFPRVLLPRDRGLFAQLGRWGQSLIAAHLMREDAPRLPGSEVFEGEIDSFRVGGYVVLKKWLQPAQRAIADPEYSRVRAAVARTIVLMREIDAAIYEAGGCERAFRE